MERPHRNAEAQHDYLVVEWEPLEKGDEGAPFEMKEYKTATFHSIGGCVEAKGSVLGKEWDYLTDNQGIALIIQPRGIMTTDDDVCFIKVKNTGESVAHVSMVARR